MIEKIDIIQENYEKILEIAKVSNSINDLCIKLGYKNYYSRKKLKILLLNNNFNIYSFNKLKKLVSVFNDKIKLEEAVKTSNSYTEVIKFLKRSERKVDYPPLKKLKKLINDKG